MRLIDDAESDSLPGFSLYISARCMFSFDDDRRSVIRCDANVRLQAGTTYDDA